MKYALLLTLFMGFGCTPTESPKLKIKTHKSRTSEKLSDFNTDKSSTKEQISEVYIFDTQEGIESYINNKKFTFGEVIIEFTKTSSNNGTIKTNTNGTGIYRINNDYRGLTLQIDRLTGISTGDQIKGLFAVKEDGVLSGFVGIEYSDIIHVNFSPIR